MDVALFRAIARHGHHLEIIAGDPAAELLAGCDFINALHVKKPRSIALRNALIYWRLSRQEWDVVVTTRFVPMLQMVGLFRHKHRLYATDGLKDMQDKGAVMFKLSILRTLIPDWDSQVDTRIPFADRLFSQALDFCSLPRGERYITVAPGRIQQRQALAGGKLCSRCRLDNRPGADAGRRDRHRRGKPPVRAAGRSLRRSKHGRKDQPCPGLRAGFKFRLASGQQQRHVACCRRQSCSDRHRRPAAALRALAAAHHCRTSGWHFAGTGNEDCPAVARVIQPQQGSWKAATGIYSSLRFNFSRKIFSTFSVLMPLTGSSIMCCFQGT